MILIDQFRSLIIKVCSQQKKGLWVLIVKSKIANKSGAYLIEMHKTDKR